MTEKITVEELKNRLRVFADERDWHQFHTPKNLSMALAVEASELLEIFQWYTPEQSSTPEPGVRKHIEEEVADILNYLIRLCDQLDIDPLEVAARKIEANAEKYPIEKARGSSAKYDKL